VCKRPISRCKIPLAWEEVGVKSSIVEGILTNIGCFWGSKYVRKFLAWLTFEKKDALGVPIPCPLSACLVHFGYNYRYQVFVLFHSSIIL
jgi:hypothetical protein